MAGDLPSDSAPWGKALLLLYSPSDLSASFWCSVVGTGFWGVCWEGIASSFPHPSPTLMWPHLTLQSIRAMGCPSVSCKVPRSHLGSTGAKISLSQQMVVCSGGSLAVPPRHVYATLFLNCILFFWMRSTP